MKVQNTRSCRRQRGRTTSILGFVAHGLTRRVQRLSDDGLIANELLDAAEHEADLLEHPYIGIEHVELARLHADGHQSGYDALRSTLTPGVRRPWWHVRGRRSALRDAGARATRLARQRAEASEQERRRGSRGSA